MAHLIVVSYDIPDDRRRLRLANAIKDFGARVQYSVFECHLESEGPEGLEKLRNRIQKLVEPTKDSVRIYRFCQDCGTKGDLWPRQAHRGARSLHSLKKGAPKLTAME